MKTIIEMQVSETRRRILELLKRYGAMTAGELGNTLGITDMGIRGHLVPLERDGCIHRKIVQKGIGRPAHVYSLTAHGDELFPRTYVQFAHSLLETIRALDGPQAVDRFFTRCTELLADQYRTRMVGNTFKKRVVDLAVICTEEGYMADWAKLTRATFLLTEHNCAIRQIAQQCPTACVHELDFFRRVLDNAEVTRDQHIIKGDSVCTYVIRLKR